MITVVSVVVVLYSVLVHLHMLLPTRRVPHDEVLCVDSALGIFRTPHVPAAQYWSHIIPEIGRINFYYTPVYFYALAAVLKLFKATPMTIGMFHVVLRLTSTAIIAAGGYHTGLPYWAVAFSAALWITFCFGPIGRPDDLALVFFTASYYVLLVCGVSAITVVVAGLLFGAALMTYPGVLILLLSLGVVVTVDQGFVAACSTMVGVGAASGIMGLFWLIWIIPFWQEFKVVFLKFAVPDARALNRVQSMGDIVKWFVVGKRILPLPFSSSLLPLVALWVLALFWSGDRQTSSLMLVGMGVIVVYHSNLRIHRKYNLLPIISTLIIWTQTLLAQHTDRFEQIAVPLIAFALIFAYQFVVAVGYSLFHLFASTMLCRTHGTRFHCSLLSHIPAGDKVLTDIGPLYYQLHVRNPLFHPAGLKGRTVGQVPYQTTYDATFHWLLLPHDLSEHRETSGDKFRWDETTFAYFQQNYELVGVSDMSRISRTKLTRFVPHIQTVFLYRFVSD